MGAKAGGGSEFNSEPNVIPLTDILLVLLIIFMVITPILKGGVDVKLPEAKNVKPEPSKGVVTISVKKDGTVYYGATPIDLNKLEDKILDYIEQKNQTKVFFRADVETDYGKVVDVIKTLKNAGIEVISIITKKKTKSQ
jgi:biopolymer transport protein TolR